MLHMASGLAIDLIDVAHSGSGAWLKSASAPTPVGLPLFRRVYSSQAHAGLLVLPWCAAARRERVAIGDADNKALLLGGISAGCSGGTCEREAKTGHG